MGSLNRTVTAALIVGLMQIWTQAGQTMSPRTSPQPALVDGFLTRARTGNQLQCGSMTIKIGPATKCFRFEPTYGKHYNFLITGAHRTTVSCDELKLYVGSRIHVSGTLDPYKTVKADQVEAGQPLLLEKRELPKTSLGNKVDWRLDDRYSGGPWIGGVSGGAFSEEMPSRLHGREPNEFSWWVNGFPLEITSSTRVMTRSNSAHAKRSIFRPQNTGGSVWVDPKAMSRVPAVTIFQNATSYVSYRAFKEHSGNIWASKVSLLDYTDSSVSRDHRVGSASKVVAPDYTTHRPGSIQYKAGPRILLVPNRAVQTYVSDATKELIPQIIQEMTNSLRQERPSIRCWVVKPFFPNPGNLSGRNEALPIKSKDTGNSKPYSAFVVPPGKMMADAIVAMPDGTILVPDTELAKFNDSAQMQFALSAAITSIMQVLPLGNSRYESQSPDKSAADRYFQTQRIIRIGIRQMYLAGYDIREAPFAWAVAQGKPVSNPLIDSKDPDKEIPWYAEYAFNYISQYYKDVDYSKLKRGRAEYQQFLKELYKADPSLPQPKAPDHARASALATH